MAQMDGAYPLPTHSIPTLDLAHHATDLADLCAFLKSREIDIRHTRIERYIKYLEHVVAGDEIDENEIFKNISDARFQSSLDWKLYVLREVHELMWILRGLRLHMPKGVDEKLRKIVSGSDFAALDNNTESRNTQFELRIASYFCQAGCEVDLSTRTDVIAITKNHALYVECKRVASPRGIQENVSKAKRQLKERMPARLGSRKVFGFIAIDVTKVAFSHNGLTLGLTNDHSRDIIQQRLSEIGDLLERTTELNDYPRLLACWLQIHIPSLISHPPATITRFSSLTIERSNQDRKDRQAMRIFHEITAVGNRPDPRELPSEKMIFRTRLEAPAGARFFFDDELLHKFLSGNTDYGKTAENIIAEIEFDGIKHEFTLIEFEMLHSSLKTKLREDYGVTPQQVGLALILEMYMQRYPYETTML